MRSGRVLSRRVLPYDYFLIAWFVLAVASAAYVAFDQFNSNPEPTVMKWGFILVTLYMGPFGLLLYVLADKEPRPGEHERFTSPLWKQGVGSTIHCVAGDATGIILRGDRDGAAGPSDVDRPYRRVRCRFLVRSLHIFQSLFMKKMMGGHLLAECPQELHARVHQHERHDGRNGADDELC